MHVDQAWQQGHARQADQDRAGGRRVTLAADRNDAAVSNHHQRLLGDLAGGRIDQAVGADRDGGGLRRGGKQRRRERGGEQDGTQVNPPELGEPGR